MIGAVVKMLVSAALLVVVIYFLIAWLLSLGRKPPARRCDDPAADPHAEPYGEVPGFSSVELLRYPPPSMTAADLEAQRRSFAFGNCAIGNPKVTREIVDAAAAAVPLPCICHEHRGDCDCTDGRKLQRGRR